MKRVILGVIIGGFLAVNTTNAAGLFDLWNNTTVNFVRSNCSIRADYNEVLRQYTNNEICYPNVSIVDTRNPYAYQTQSTGGGYYYQYPTAQTYYYSQPQTYYYSYQQPQYYNYGNTGGGYYSNGNGYYGSNSGSYGPAIDRYVPSINQRYNDPYYAGYNGYDSNYGYGNGGGSYYGGYGYGGGDYYGDQGYYY